MPQTKPPYPTAFRQQILEPAYAGRTPSGLSREFGVTAQTISEWRKPTSNAGRVVFGSFIFFPVAC